jgi:hypothetical protein
MNDEILTDTLLRQYLLRKVNEDERQRVEKLYLMDSQARDRVLTAEQDLIEDYLEGSLNAEDREIFLLHYAHTPEQRRKLRINQTIKDWAVTETQTTPRGASIWSRFLETIRLRPAFVVPIAVGILIAIVIAYVWLNRRMEYRAIQREVAELNTPASLSQNPPQMVSLDLRPVTVRSGETQNQLTKLADTRTVELKLPSIGTDQYPTYHVVVHRVENKGPITTVDVAVKTGNPVRIRLPAPQLTRGSYRLESNGVAPDGSIGPFEEYTFVVND